MLFSKKPEILSEIGNSLSSLVVGFMFEDFSEQLSKINNKDSNQAKELHVYMITGEFFTISEILKVVRNQIIEKTSPVSRVVSIGFKPSSTVYYNEYKDKYSGMTLWNKVRESTIKNTIMNVYMNISNLKKLISIF